MTEWEEVEFSPGPPVAFTCEEQELRARAHPQLELPQIGRSNWLDWRTSFGTTVRLPSDFQPFGEDEPDRMLWTTEQGETFFVLRHDGSGNGSIAIMPQGESVSFEFEGQFCVKLAGRDATIAFSRIKSEGEEVFCASSDAGITPGTGIGVVIWAGSAEQRNRLLWTLVTMQVQ